MQKDNADKPAAPAAPAVTTAATAAPAINLETHDEDGFPRSKVFVPTVTPFKKRLKGIRVARGEDWRHTTAEQRDQWFAELESFWKKNINQLGKKKGLQSTLTLGRG